ncbi:MAG: hypothetical protein ACOC44_17435 [Promethearchaeia archaeon]
MSFYESDIGNAHSDLPMVLLLINRTKDSSGVCDVDLFLEDGSAAYFYHNGEHICLLLHQNRISQPIARYSEIWDDLARGKIYIKDFPNTDVVTAEMIREALNWLWMPNHGFHIVQIERGSREENVQLLTKFLNGETPEPNTTLFDF